jgi:excisionase family DNA binding protein
MSKLVSAKQVADALGVNVATVYRAARDGQITNYGLRGTYRFDLDKILNR